MRNVQKLLVTTTLATGVVLGTISAHATTFDFTTMPPGDYGPVAHFDLLTVTAIGPNDPHVLITNIPTSPDHPDDKGIGITSPYGDGEITPGYALQFYLGQFVGQDLKIAANSTIVGTDYYSYSFGDTPGSPNSVPTTGTGDDLIDLGKITQPYLFATAVDVDTKSVLISDLEISGISSVPEPTNSLILALTMLGFFGLASWYKKSRL